MSTETKPAYHGVDNESGEVVGALIQGAFPGMAEHRPANRAACIAALGQLTRDIDVLTRRLKARKRDLQSTLDLLDVIEDTADDD